jgi:ArsR family transcriptional regulator
MTSVRERTDLGRAAQRFHALSDATRLQLVLALVGGERCVCDLMAVMGAAQSRLSFHLRVLKEAGLVRDRREGRWVYYALETDVLESMADLLSAAREGRWRPRSLPVRQGAGCC